MPTYDFQCQRCGRLFEQRMTMGELGQGKRPACPDCGDRQPRQVFSSPVTILAPGSKSSAPSPTPIGGCGSGSCGCG